MKSLVLCVSMMLLLILAAYVSCTESITYDPYKSSVDFCSGKYQETEGMLLTIKLNDNVLRDKGLVHFDITYKNMTESPIHFWLSLMTRPYQTELVNSQGEILKPKKLKAQWGSIARCTLKPGAERKDGVMLNYIYDLNKPGEYTVRLARSVNRLDNTGYTWIYTNQITFKLTQEQIDIYAKSKKPNK